MKKKIFFCLLILTSCSQSNLKDSFNDNFDFKEDRSFKQIKKHLDDYANNSPFPNIDE